MENVLSYVGQEDMIEEPVPVAVMHFDDDSKWPSPEHIADCVIDISRQIHEFVAEAEA